MSNGPRPWTGAAVLVGVTSFVATVAALHFAQPAYEPTHQLMSELALGPFGWAMEYDRRTEQGYSRVFMRKTLD